MSLEELCELLNTVVGLNSEQLLKYQTNFRANNINGKVLAHCDLDDLKKVRYWVVLRALMKVVLVTLGCA